MTANSMTNKVIHSTNPFRISGKSKRARGVIELAPFGNGVTISDGMTVPLAAVDVEASEAVNSLTLKRTPLDAKNVSLPN